PRHHIGESLMPQTYWTFKRLGMLEKLKASDFVRKQSVQFITPNGKESQPFYFTDRDPNEWSVTWQVKRDRFDQMMLDNARERGAEIREGVRVSRIRFQDDRAIGVSAVIDGRATDLDARVVVDATGQVALLASQLGIRTPDPQLKKGAIYAHYRGGKRDEGRDEGATLIIHTRDNRGWFWYIPLENDVVSVGLVSDPHDLFTGRGDDPAVTLDEEIAECDAVRRRLESAQRISRVYVTSDFSYRADRVAGDGWVLVGDAFGFLDPVYSSGVMLALKSAEMAADAIHDGLTANDVSAARLGRFGPELAAGMHRLRQLVYAFYDREFSAGRFVRAHPEHQDHLVRLLIGDVFNDEVGAIFQSMRQVCTLPDPLPLGGPASA
ncbi:MAG: NAD(P)/FAD-dependent oxidoreductase, partial [Phycisphaerae bacterium]